MVDLRMYQDGACFTPLLLLLLFIRVSHDDIHRVDVGGALCSVSLKMRTTKLNQLRSPYIMSLGTFITGPIRINLKN